MVAMATEGDEGGKGDGTGAQPQVWAPRTRAADRVREAVEAVEGECEEDKVSEAMTWYEEVPRAWVVYPLSLVAFQIPASVSIPTAIFYLKKRCCDDQWPDHNDPLRDCSSDTVSHDAAHWITLYIVMCMGLNFFPVQLLGPRSDSLGRKVLLLTPSVGSLLSYAGLLSVGHWGLAQGWIIAAASLAGLGGGVWLFVAGAFASIADVTPDPAVRTARIGIGEGLLFTCLFLANLCGGMLADHVGFVGTMLVVCGVQVLVVAAVAGVPEALPPGRRKTTSPSMCSIVASARLMMRSRGHAVLSVTFFIVCLIQVLYTTVLILFVTHVYKFSDSVAGYAAAAPMAGNGISAVFILPFFTRRGVSGQRLLLVGLIAFVVFYLVAALVQEEAALWASLSTFLASGLVSPLLRAELSRRTPADEQGAAFGLLSALQSLSLVAAPFILQDGVYAPTVHRCAGCAFIVGAALTGGTAILVAMLLPPPPPPGYELTADGDEGDRVTDTAQSECTARTGRTSRSCASAYVVDAGKFT